MPGADKEQHDEAQKEILERKKRLRLPEENLLHFVENYSPILKRWQREILQIV